jgi:hypothetical protein
MANNKNRTRKRNKNTYKKKYGKIATRHMRGGGMFSIFNDLRSSLSNSFTSSFSIFGSRARSEATNKYNDITTNAKTKITEAKDFVAKKAACIQACSKNN